MGKNVIVNVSVANIYREPSFKSEVTTQALLGEELRVLDMIRNSNENQDEINWYYIRQWDNYEGWIHRSLVISPSGGYLERLRSHKSMVVDELVSLVYQKKDETSPVLRDLVFGDILFPVTPESTPTKNGWVQVILPDEKKGWTHARTRFQTKKNIRNDIVKQAKRFMGIPYVWGGKSSKGFDCSGFVQTVMKSAGIAFPRDAYQQEQVNKLVDIKLEYAQEGDLIFFDTGGKKRTDHVAIALSKDDFIHSSGYVRIQTFKTRSPHYNGKLHKTISSVKSIERFCE